MEQFIAITGAERAVAVGMLEACNGNIELAVEMHLDSGMESIGASGSSTFSESPSTSTVRPNNLPDIVQNSTGTLSNSSSSTGFEGEKYVLLSHFQLYLVLRLFVENCISQQVMVYICKISKSSRKSNRVTRELNRLAYRYLIVSR